MAMDSSSVQSHHQEIGSQTLESMLIPTKSQPEKKPKPAEQALKCPRCDSTNTKFCYYNNYSLSQPRYFCKSCRRYWTKGGTLRNVPVGGGCRKNKRSSSSSSSSSKKNHDQAHTRIPSPIPSYSPLSYDSNVFQKQTSGQLGLDDHTGFPMPGHPNMAAVSDNCGLFGGFLEIPRGFQNLYYGIGEGVSLGLEINGGNVGMGLGGLNQEMGFMGFDQEINGATAATVKQEMCSDIVGRENGESSSSRNLWGLFPWQNVGGDGNMGDLGSWNGIGSSNWHGLLNSPLM